MSEQHLFILWEKARNKEQEVLEEIKSQFKILKMLEIQWDKEKFLENLSSFYGFDHSGKYNVIYERGNGKFLVIIVVDENPEYIEIQTTKGVTNVNKKMYETKLHLRKEYFGGQYLLHATNNLQEFRHDFTLLTGKNFEDFMKNNVFDGKLTSLVQNLPAIDGWKNQEHIFYILNETVEYVLIRDIENAPFSLPFPDFPNSGHYFFDYEILTNDVQSLRYILAPEQNNNEFAFGVFIDLQGKVQPFHLKYLGDRYFDINIEKKLLETKKKNKNNVWIIGSDEYYFYTLLYHGIIHKENYKKYNEIFSEIAPKIGISDYKCDIKYLRKLLSNWMGKNKYKYYQPIDMPERVIHYENITNKKLLNNQPEIFIFQDNLNTIIINSDFLIKAPDYASSYIKGLNPYIILDKHIMNSNNKLYKEFSTRKRNEIAWIYRKRFGRIVKTTIKYKKYLFTERIILGMPSTIESKYLKVNITTVQKRRYIKGIEFNKFIATIKNERDIKVELEKFIAEVFYQFSDKNNFQILRPEAWDALPNNCIVDLEKRTYNFFDLEYSFKGNLSKTYLLWRIIEHTSINIVNKEQLYEYFCHRFCLPNYWFWNKQLDINVHRYLWESFYPMDFKISLPLIFKIFINILLFFNIFVPLKKQRRNWRNKLKEFIHFPNKKLLKRYFIGG